MTAPRIASLVFALGVLAVVAGSKAPAYFTAHAQGPGARFERPVAAEAPGPNRLPVDGALVLGSAKFILRGTYDTPGSYRFASREWFPDLRLHDASGREVPYLLLYPEFDTPEWPRATVLPIATTEKTSGFEADLGSLQVVDMIDVTGIQGPYLKRLVLEGSGDRQHWTMLAPQGTLFDLPAERLQQHRVPFRAGPYRFLRVTWDDTNSGRVPLPTAVLARRAPSGRAEPPPVVIEATFERRPSEPGRSRYRIRLPGGGLPLFGLALHAGGGHVFREAVVTEPYLQGGQLVPREIGRATLARVVRDGVTAESMNISIKPPSEPVVDLLVEDGNNPPLDLQRVTLVVPRFPWIYFESPGGPITARYGDPSLRMPRYDLEAVRDSIDLSTVREAKWGEPRAMAPNTEPAPAASAPAMPDAGAPLDPTGYRFRRTVTDAPAGLVALPLDASVLAHSRGAGRMFEDVRVVDEAGKQIPYLLERQEEPLSLDLTLAPYSPTVAELRAADGKNRSAYAVTLPYDRLPNATLVLETSARVFTRTVRAGAERPADRQRRDAWFEAFAAKSWTHADEQLPPPALSIPLGTTRDRRIIVVVDEGDNSALPLSKARLLLPSYRVRFYHPGRPLTLVYGRDDVSLPRYDLALLAPRVMGSEAREVTAAPAEERASGPIPALVSPRFFWAGLAVAVLVIGGIIVRLMRAT